MAYLVGEFLILLTLHRCHLTNPAEIRNPAKITPEPDLATLHVDHQGHDILFIMVLLLNLLCDLQYVCVQRYPVEDVLLRYDKGVVNGPQLVQKLLSGNTVTRAERIWLVKVLGKYLMKVAFT